MDSIRTYQGPIFVVEGEKCAAALHQLGLAAVVVVGLVSAALLWSGRETLAYGVLGAFALLDFAIYPLLKNVTVCYRCQAEFRGAYRRTAPGFDLHAAEELEREYGRRPGPALRSRPLPR